MKWDLKGYPRWAKVCSHKAALFPKPFDKTGLRQAVVRITSKQTLNVYGRDGNLLPTSKEDVTTTEYLVIQKMVQGGVETPWMVWGTTTETTRESP
jgi:hypothetical protein